MTEIIPITEVKPVMFGVLKITWRDGYVGLVDLRPVIADGEAFVFLRRDEGRFFNASLEKSGQKIFWRDDDGDEIDFGSAALRARAERQAKLLSLAS